MATGRGGGQSMTGRNATGHNPLRLATSYENRQLGAGHRIEMVEVVAVSGRTAATLAEAEDAKLEEGGVSELNTLLAQTCSTSEVALANRAVNTADRSAKEAPM